MRVPGRMVITCLVVKLFVVVTANSSSVRHSSADLVTSQQLKPCDRPHHNHSSKQPAGNRRRRRRRSVTSEDEKIRDVSANVNNDRSDTKPKSSSPPPPPPPQKVSLNDKSVAAALAMSANVGRGGQPQQSQPALGRPPAVTAPPAHGSHAGRQPATAKTKDAGGGEGGELVNVMLALGCEAEPCQHGGVCYTDAFNPRGFSCRCTTGYFGDICEYDTELCVSGPCLNDAKCMRDPSDSSAYKCDCAPGFYGLNCEHELTREALELMNGGTNSMSRYYDVRMNPILFQLAVAASSLLLLIVVVTFFCCIEIRRDSIVEKRKLLRAIGLEMEFPKISLIGIAFKLILNCLQCRCIVPAKKDKDPRANIPLIMPSTAPPVPRASQLSHMSDVLTAQQWQQLEQLEAQRAHSLQQQIQLQQLQQQLRQSPVATTSGHVTRQLSAAQKT